MTPMTIDRDSTRPKPRKSMMSNGFSVSLRIVADQAVDLGEDAHAGQDHPQHRHHDDAGDAEGDRDEERHLHRRPGVDPRDGQLDPPGPGGLSRRRAPRPAGTGRARRPAGPDGSAGSDVTLGSGLPPWGRADLLVWPAVLTRYLQLRVLLVRRLDGTPPTDLVVHRARRYGIGGGESARPCACVAPLELDDHRRPSVVRRAGLGRPRRPPARGCAPPRRSSHRCPGWRTSCPGCCGRAA